ncbi:MAG: hypothetical protein COB15_09190 [Flavobacteriales bacterium]|nr:MAG: hypothetical protein COB15_09190 [Flavobacteriales bacterium]
MEKRTRHIIFSLLLLSVFHISLLMLFKTVKQKNEIVQVFDHYDKNPKHYKFLFLGTSHVKRGVNITIVDSSYSMAYYGQNNINAYYLLKYLLENYSNNFEYICLPNDFDYYSKQALCNLNNMFFYNHFFDYDEYGKLNNSYYQSKKEEFLLNYFPYTQLRKMLKSKTERATKGNKDFSLKNIKTRQKIAHDYIYKGHKINHVNDIYNPLSIVYLEMTLQLLKKYNKKAIFINYPLSNEMNLEIDAFGNYNHKSDSLIIKSKHKIIDLSKAFIKHDEYFFDAHHLNKKGGTNCSHLIQEKFNNY